MIFVRGGKISSGTLETPLEGKYTHKIVLHGTETDNSFAFDSKIEVGNNALIVTGDLEMHGEDKTSWTKLIGDAQPNDNFIFVENVN